MLAAAAAAQLAVSLLAASASASARASPPAPTLPTARAATTPPSTATKPPAVSTSKSTAPATPSPSPGVPKSTVVVALAVGVPILLALIGSIMIWGYMLGRRDEHEEVTQALLRKDPKRPRPGRRKNVRYVELAGNEVLEMATGANTVEMPEDSHPPAEMPERGEPVELPALEAWLMMK